MVEEETIAEMLANKIGLSNTATSVNGDELRFGFGKIYRLNVRLFVGFGRSMR